jgi:hypothetical protein
MKDARTYAEKYVTLVTKCKNKRMKKKKKKQEREHIITKIFNIQDGGWNKRFMQILKMANLY